MYRHPFSSLTLLIVSALLLAAVPSQAGGTTNQWQVTANGVKGLLDLSTQAGGRINGTLLGHSVEGWLVGRHLVLIREGEAGPETWEAWLATSEHVQHDGSPVLAGTFIRQPENEPLPWFGVSTTGAAGTNTTVVIPPAAYVDEVASQPVTRSVPLPPSDEPKKATAVPPEKPPVPPATATQSLLPSGKPSLAGSWQTPDGPLSIRQNGSSLVFVLPDREVSGRLTGSESLIGGFGPGCCKGQLEQSFAVIAWDNGSRWIRN